MVEVVGVFEYLIYIYDVVKCEVDVGFDLLVVMGVGEFGEVE